MIGLWFHLHFLLGLEITTMQESSNLDLTPPSPGDGGKELLVWLRWMRDEHPVLVDEQGVNHVFRYEDIKAAVNDPATFSNDQSRFIRNLEEFSTANMAWSDPPYHTKLRKLVNQAFTPRTVAELEKPITDIYCQLLDDLDGVDEFDLTDKVALPLPSMVMARLLGVPDQDSGLFRGWITGLLLGQMDKVDPVGKSKAAFAEVVNYLGNICRERRASPKDDLLSALVAARVDDVALRLQEESSLPGRTETCDERPPDKRSDGALSGGWWCAAAGLVAEDARRTTRRHHQTAYLSHFSL